jgi:hypothetical protein
MTRAVSATRREASQKQRPVHRSHVGIWQRGAPPGPLSRAGTFVLVSLVLGHKLRMEEQWMRTQFGAPYEA